MTSWLSGWHSPYQPEHKIYFFKNCHEGLFDGQRVQKRGWYETESIAVPTSKSGQENAGLN